MRYDIVMSGASSKIPLHLGFIRCLESNNIKYNEIYGTSSGSIVAASVALGHNAGYLANILRKTDLTKFTRISIWRNILNIFSQSWLNDGNKLEEFLDGIYMGKTLDSVKHPLHVFTHCLETGTWRDFNSRENPTMKISKAVRMSCSLPIMFKPVKFKGKHYIDGGISKNFPVDVSRRDCIGHIITGDSDSNIEWQKIRKSSFGIKVIYQMVSANVRESIKEKDNCIVVHSVKNKSPYDFSLDETELSDMIRCGYNNTIKKII